jgi:hypothetical protein
VHCLRDRCHRNQNGGNHANHGLVHHALGRLLLKLRRYFERDWDRDDSAPEEGLVQSLGSGKNFSPAPAFKE